MTPALVKQMIEGNAPKTIKIFTTTFSPISDEVSNWCPNANQYFQLFVKIYTPSVVTPKSSITFYVRINSNKLVFFTFTMSTAANSRYQTGFLVNIVNDMAILMSPSMTVQYINSSSGAYYDIIGGGDVSYNTITCPVAALNEIKISSSNNSSWDGANLTFDTYGVSL